MCSTKGIVPVAEHSKMNRPLGHRLPTIRNYDAMLICLVARVMGLISRPGQSAPSWVFQVSDSCLLITAALELGPQEMVYILVELEPLVYFFGIVGFFILFYFY